MTVKAGLTAPGGMSLKEDLHFSFETTGEEADRWDYMRLRLAGDYAETFLPGDPLSVALYAGDDMTGAALRRLAAPLRGHQRLHQGAAGPRRVLR